MHLVSSIILPHHCIRTQSAPVNPRNVKIFRSRSFPSPSLCYTLFRCRHFPMKLFSSPPLDLRQILHKDPFLRACDCFSSRASRPRPSHATPLKTHQDQTGFSRRFYTAIMMEICFGFIGTGSHRR